jgi:hypothetical protein
MYKIKHLQWRLLKSRSDPKLKWWISDDSIGKLSVTSNYPRRFELWDDIQRIKVFKTLTESKREAQKIHDERVRKLLEPV